MMALKAETRNATMNVKLGSGDGFEHQNWKAMMALNAKTENSDDGSKRQTENSDGSKHQNWKAMMALNAKPKIVMMALNAKLRIVVTTLNAETEDATLNIDLKTDDGSERRN